MPISSNMGIELTPLSASQHPGNQSPSMEGSSGDRGARGKPKNKSKKKDMEVVNVDTGQAKQEGNLSPSMEGSSGDRGARGKPENKSKKKRKKKDMEAVDVDTGQAKQEGNLSPSMEGSSGDHGARGKPENKSMSKRKKKDMEAVDVDTGQAKHEGNQSPSMQGSSGDRGARGKPENKSMSKRKKKDIEVVDVDTGQAKKRRYLQEDDDAVYAQASNAMQMGGIDRNKIEEDMMALGPDHAAILEQQHATRASPKETQKILEKNTREEARRLKDGSGGDGDLARRGIADRDADGGWLTGQQVARFKKGKHVREKNVNGKHLLICCFRVPPADNHAAAFVCRAMISAYRWLLKHNKTLLESEGFKIRMVVVARAAQERDFNHFFSAFSGLMIRFCDVESLCSRLCLTDDPYTALVLNPNREVLCRSSHCEPYDFFVDSAGLLHFPFPSPTAAFVDLAADEVGKTIRRNLMAKESDFVINVLDVSVTLQKLLLGQEPVVRRCIDGSSISLSELYQKNKCVAFYMCVDGSFLQNLEAMRNNFAKDHLGFEIVLVHVPFLSDTSSCLNAVTLQLPPATSSSLSSWSVMRFSCPVICRFWHLFALFHKEDKDRVIILTTSEQHRYRFVVERELHPIPCPKEIRKRVQKLSMDRKKDREKRENDRKEREDDGKERENDRNERENDGKERENDRNLACMTIIISLPHSTYWYLGTPVEERVVQPSDLFCRFHTFYETSLQKKIARDKEAVYVEEEDETEEIDTWIRHNSIIFKKEKVKALKHRIFMNHGQYYLISMKNFFELAQTFFDKHGCRDFQVHLIEQIEATYLGSIQASKIPDFIGIELHIVLSIARSYFEQYGCQPSLFLGRNEKMHPDLFVLKEVGLKFDRTTITPVTDEDKYNTDNRSRWLRPIEVKDEDLVHIYAPSLAANLRTVGS